MNLLSVGTQEKSLVRHENDNIVRDDFYEISEESNGRSIFIKTNVYTIVNQNLFVVQFYIIN